MLIFEAKQRPIKIVSGTLLKHIDVHYVSRGALMTARQVSRAPSEDEDPLSALPLRALVPLASKLRLRR